MKNYIDDHSINHNKSFTIGIWNISELSWWLRNDVSKPRGRRFHSRKITSEFIYFHILTQYNHIIGRISACHGILIRIIIFRLVAQFLLRRIFIFIFFPHTSHNDKILIIKHVFIAVWSISSLGPFCWRVLSDCAITWVPPTPTGQRGKLYEKKKIYIWFSHFTWTQTHRW